MKKSCSFILVGRDLFYHMQVVAAVRLALWEENNILFLLTFNNPFCFDRGRLHNIVKSCTAG